MESIELMEVSSAELQKILREGRAEDRREEEANDPIMTTKIAGAPESRMTCGLGASWIEGGFRMDGLVRDPRQSSRNSNWLD
jgi:hypothetical protein